MLERCFDTACYGKVTADPVLLVELGDEAALDQVAPIDDLPEDVHCAVEAFLVFKISVASIL